MNCRLIRVFRGIRNGLAALATGACLFTPAAMAQSSDAIALAKLSAGLIQTIDPTTAPLQPWVRQATGGLLVRAIVATRDGSPSLLANLAQSVLSLGGSVHYVYPSLNAMAVVLPASKLLELGRNPDVVSIAQNGAVVTRPACCSAPPAQPTC